MRKQVYLVLFSLMVILMVPVLAHGGYVGYYHGGYHGHVVVGGGVWVGPGWWGPGWWGPGWWGPGYYGYGYPYPYYSSPPVVYQQQPVYDMQTQQQEEEEYYWYYCPDAKNYYPYVKQCPNGWIKVVPSPGPSK